MPRSRNLNTGLFAVFAALVFSLQVMRGEAGVRYLYKRINLAEFHSHTCDKYLYDKRLEEEEPVPCLVESH